MLDQKYINIIVRAIMPELYRIQGFRNSFWDFQKQRQESPPKADYRDTEGIHGRGTRQRLQPLLSVHGSPPLMGLEFSDILIVL